MTRDDRERARRDVPLAELEVGPANGAGRDAQEELSGPRDGIVQDRLAERSPGDRLGGGEDERAHGGSKAKRERCRGGRRKARKKTRRRKRRRRAAKQARRRRES
jgi:hypothetical protein